MSYLIGVGLLPPEPLYNFFRNIELRLAEELGNQQGLCQPPHITVKRPFNIGTLEALTAFTKLINDLAQTTKSLVIRYDGYDSFESGTLYAKANRTKALLALHSQLLQMCGGFGAEPDEFEGDNFAAHTSLAVGLDEKGLEMAKKTVGSYSVPNDEFLSSHLAVFMFIDKQWIIVSKHRFCDLD